VIDPQKGFLATESVFYAGRETPFRRQTMRVEEVAPGVWYPVGYEETEYTEPKPPAEPPAVTSWTKATLKDIKINEPIPARQFDIEALGLQTDKPDITVLRTTVEGRTIPHVYREGKLVPQRGQKK
jgi:hypothetical protein